MTSNHRWLLVLVILTLSFVSKPVLATERSIQLSLFTPFQLFPESDSVTGVRLNLLYGKNASVTGLDWGLVNHSTSGVSMGWQLGFVGLIESDFVGLQDNQVNVVKGNFKGLQLGFVNYANSATGLQFGVVNYAANMNGLQIGLLNFIDQGGVFPVFPFVNWSL